jgi:hypothetical protein
MWESTYHSVRSVPDPHTLSLKRIIVIASNRDQNSPADPRERPTGEDAIYVSLHEFIDPRNLSNALFDMLSF